MNNKAEWQLETLRLTIFIPERDEKAEAQWFEDCLAISPETSELRRAEGIRTDTGVLEGRRYTLQVQAGRADWSIAPAMLDDAQQGTIGSIGELSALGAGFSKWLSNLGSTHRFALGAIAKISAADKVESYTLLADYLPKIELDPIGSSEFTYRINRPRMLELSDGSAIQVNRISTWGAVMLQRLVQQIVFGGPVSLAQPTAIGHWARCELDLSTDAFRQVSIPSEVRAELLGKLLEMSREIFQQGDVP